MFRDMPSIRAMVCSAVEMVLPPGVFITTMPCRVAAWVSMLSTPTPARAMARSRVLPSQHVGGDLHAAAADGPVGLQQGVAQVRALQAGADFHFQIAGRLQQGQAVLGQLVENKNFGHDRVQYLLGYGQKRYRSMSSAA